ncbi:cysteine dioxygenase [Aquabacter cavernae]|uniref:cysteine dioxygenase family protein n=1 Tax=Aquabacter cavernae TaxID=2496029 RepID=UPI000F8CB4BB|nr:cysteine dioxygenase [Aquabacter cavernae]
MALNGIQSARVAATVERVKALTAGAVGREQLERVREELYGLAAEPDLFPFSDFPAPEPGGDRFSLRYRLHEDADRTHALYLNALIPGKLTKPHNHGTWAVIVALEGEELNRVYVREDDGSDPERAQLRLADEVVVKPGQGIAFLGDDIHSVHILGGGKARMFHFYGRALETLTDRKGFDLETGRVSNYNQNFMSPTVG